MHSIVRLRDRFPTLKSFGIAAEYFPAYTSRNTTLHSLDVVLGTFVVSGCGAHNIGDEVRQDEAGSFAITHYGLEHRIQTESPMEIVNLYLDPQHHPLPPIPPILRPLLQSFLPLHPGFYNRCNRLVRIRFGDPEPVAAMLRTIERESRRREKAHREVMESLLSAFLILCARQLESSGLIPGAALTREDGGIERLRRHLDDSLGEQHTLAQLSKRVRMSPETLCRAFKRHTGKSIFDYIHQRRIELAAFALRNTGDKIVGIALDSGFQDVSFFNRKFRELMGCTPGQYRNRCRAVG